MSVALDTIEHTFETEGVSMALLRPAESELRSGASAARVAELQARINGMQSSAPPTRSIPTRADLAVLLPGGLREGSVYRVHTSTSLTAISLAEASGAGRWTAWVGWPRLGASALEQIGITLERTAVVPTPGERWLSIASSLADAMSVIALQLPHGTRVAPGEAARLTARLRERGSALLVTGDWPGADAELHVDESRWSGLGVGHGVLLDRQLRVSVRDRSGRVRRGPVGVRGPVRHLEALGAEHSAPAHLHSHLEQASHRVPAELAWAVSA